MFYSCMHTATVGFKGLKSPITFIEMTLKNVENVVKVSQ